MQIARKKAKKRLPDGTINEKNRCAECAAPHNNKYKKGISTFLKKMYLPKEDRKIGI
jgi:hypothetical protein